MTQPERSNNLRSRSEGLAAQLPALRAEANRLAGTAYMGEHGRRRAGNGEDFWQFRHAVAGDAAKLIDWRRSAREEGLFVREKEWQSVQTVFIWADPGLSMAFSGHANRPTKEFCARSVALATAILLVQMGERVGLLSDHNPPQSGIAQIERLTHALVAPPSQDDHTEILSRDFPKGSHAVLISDFLGDLDQVERVVREVADVGGRGALVQILDPVEESFPFDGRTVFESVAGTTQFETRRARGLKEAYREKLAARKDALRTIALKWGWQTVVHHTDTPSSNLMLWLHRSIEGNLR